MKARYTDFARTFLNQEGRASNCMRDDALPNKVMRRTCGDVTMAAGRQSREQQIHSVCNNASPVCSNDAVDVQGKMLLVMKRVSGRPEKQRCVRDLVIPQASFVFAQ